MAQGSKSRIVIWAIVGILVVVAVVMLISKPKNTGKPPVNAEKFAQQMESRFQKLEKRIDEAKAQFPGAPAEKWQQMSDGIARARQVVAGMSGLTDQKVLGAKRDSVQQAYAGARKVLKDITGKDVGSDSTGGK